MNKLKELRLEHGFTHKQMANFLGYKYPSGYSNLETGRNKVSLENARKISEIFNVDIDSIFFEH